jgi:hypothetical protein
VNPVAITHASMAATAVAAATVALFLARDGSPRGAAMFTLLAALQAIGATMWFFR